MNTLGERIGHLESIVSGEDITKQLERFDRSLQDVMKKIPEFSKLESVTLPTPVDKNKVEYEVKLLLGNINEYRSLVDNLTYINSANIDRYQYQEVDISILLENKEKIISLTNRYMSCLVKSLLVLQKYVNFVTTRNDTLLSAQEDMRRNERKKVIEEPNTEPPQSF